ncbi:hypothetical protein GCM10009789_35500 [Kribbella sancticallisti]|uniref:Methyltransferase domain-containing protein n=1 Tax=Kribbella sancticallisti TaxID=460087 RepID=A0ABP4PES7_9ACTN
MTSSTYLLADQPSESERLQLQSHVWEPSGLRLLAEMGSCPGGLVADIGCGVLGWLRLLSEWVGAEGEVVGTDIDDRMLASAERMVSDEGLATSDWSRTICSPARWSPEPSISSTPVSS